MKDTEAKAREYAAKNNSEWGCPNCGDEAHLSNPNLEAQRDIDGYIAGAGWMAGEKDKEIEKLRDALKEATEWVSCSERYPDSPDSVLVRYWVDPAKGRVSPVSMPGFWAYAIGHRSDGRWFVLGNVVSCIEDWRPIDSPKVTELIER